MVAVNEQVDAPYAAGRNTVMGDEKPEILVRDHDVECYERQTFFHNNRCFAMQKSGLSATFFAFALHGFNPGDARHSIR